MIGILLVTHGRLAEELRAAALTIQPGLERIVAVALEWSETGEDAREKIRRGLEQADEGDGAVILTDMFGGTPTHLTLRSARTAREGFVGGDTLRTVRKCGSLQRRGRRVTEVAHVAKHGGQRSIYGASALLAEEPVPAEALPKNGP